MDIFKRSTKNITFDLHTESHYDITAGQAAFLTIWIGASILWLLRLRGCKKCLVKDKQVHSALLEVTTTHGHDNPNTIKQLEGSSLAESGEKEMPNLQSENADKTFTPVKPLPSFDMFLKNVAIFGIVLIFFYLCDYRKVFPLLKRVYSRDEFLFLVFLLFLIACAFTIKPTSDKILNRDQTEEWKGWMQVMFVWYHYFSAQEWYNWIRVYIAAYVWMTGFGNFSFFWVHKDFSCFRFLKMQFRLNFLVICLCVVTSNEYMLYYICAMHSYWFISVYLFMGILKSWNTDRKKMGLKFCVYFLVNFLIFEVSIIRDSIFKPFLFVLKYSDPRFDPLHEWLFRSGLDHWACFFGMICAYNYPHLENLMNNWEKIESFGKRIIIKISFVMVCIIALVIWYFSVMCKDKLLYNRLHPYTSLVPIFCFVLIRNSFPVLRQYYINMFAFLGKITLETYLSQLHIYLQSNAKHLIGYLPDYHLLNFALATIIYIPISYFLFTVTTEFSSYLIPNNMKSVGKNALLITLIFIFPYVTMSMYMSA